MEESTQSLAQLSTVEAKNLTIVSYEKFVRLPKRSQILSLYFLLAVLKCGNILKIIVPMVEVAIPKGEGLGVVKIMLPLAGVSSTTV